MLFDSDLLDALSAIAVGVVVAVAVIVANLVYSDSAREARHAAGRTPWWDPWRCR